MSIQDYENMYNRFDGGFSAAIVVRDRKVLMMKVNCFERIFHTCPGGWIQEGETPQAAALRGLKEDCGLDGTIVCPLAIQYDHKGRREYSFLVSIGNDQTVVPAYEPKLSPENQFIQEVRWYSLKELTEKERAFLWYYGLFRTGSFFDEILSWGDEISYPKGEA